MVAIGSVKSQIGHTKTNLMIFMTPHIIHGADDLAAVYKAKIEERDQFLASIYGEGHVDDDFYAMLPTKEDGAYTTSESDESEKQRREELLERGVEVTEIQPKERELSRGRLGDDLGHGGARLVLGPPGESDAGTALRQGARRLLADPGVRAGDQEAASA